MTFSLRTARSLALALFVTAAGVGPLGCANRAALPPRAAALNDTGAAALASGDLATAEARIALALEYNPRFTEAWVNLGLVELARGNLDLAQKHFERARTLNPDLPVPHHAIGLLADRRGLGRDAERNYTMALKVDPGFAPARANLARRLYERGAFDDARQQFLRLTEVSPETLAGWLGLSESLTRLGREAEADDVLVRARAKFGEAPDLLVLVARQLLRRGAAEEAEAVLAPLTGALDEGRAAVAWSWIAVTRLGREDAEGAIAAAREALQRRRDEPVAVYATGAALLMKGDKAAAQTWLARAKELSPSNAAVAPLLAAANAPR